MSENKNIYYLKEAALAFGMNIKDFAGCIGYTRQSLYQAANGIQKLKKVRLVASKNKLDMMNKAMYEADKAKAKEMFLQRREIIEKLMDRLIGQDV